MLKFIEIGIKDGVIRYEYFMASDGFEYVKAYNTAKNQTKYEKHGFNPNSIEFITREEYKEKLNDSSINKDIRP